MIAAALILAVAPPSDAACLRAIRLHPPARVDDSCWRMDPVHIGMTRSQVEARLGRPDEGDVTSEAAGGGPTATQAVYVYPRDLARRLARDPQPSLRFDALELTYVGERLSRIGNDIAVRSSGPGCRTTEDSPGAPTRINPAFAPFRRFLGVRIGDRLSAVRSRLGPWASISRGGDFISFFRVPVTLDVDEDPPVSRKRVNGFAIGADSMSVMEGGELDVTLDRDPVTCRVRGFELREHSGF